MRVCRPGAYESRSERCGRHVEFNEAFGGRKTLKSPVIVKCTKGIPDQVCILKYMHGPEVYVCILMYSSAASVSSHRWGTTTRTASVLSAQPATRKHSSPSKAFTTGGSGWLTDSHTACYITVHETNSILHRTLQGFHKVRDCTSIHRHEFPGKDPKTIVS